MIMVFDEGFDVDATPSDLEDWLFGFTRDRHAPLNPDAFNRELRHRSFTGKGDYDIVSDLYLMVFLLVANIPAFQFVLVKWASQDIIDLTDALAWGGGCFRHLVTIAIVIDPRVSTGKLVLPEDSAWARFMAGLCHCPALKTLELRYCGCATQTGRALATVISSGALSNLEHVNMNDNDIDPETVSLLRDVWSRHKTGQRLALYDQDLKKKIEEDRLTL